MTAPKNANLPAIGSRVHHSAFGDGSVVGYGAFGKARAATLVIMFDGGTRKREFVPSLAMHSITIIEGKS